MRDRPTRLPYLAWVSFAAVLNLAVERMIGRFPEVDAGALSG